MYLSPEYTYKTKLTDHIVSSQKCNTAHAPKACSLISFKSELIWRPQIANVVSESVNNWELQIIPLGPAGPLFLKMAQKARQMVDQLVPRSEFYMTWGLDLDQKGQKWNKDSAWSQILFSLPCSLNCCCYLRGGSILRANFGTCHC